MAASLLLPSEGIHHEGISINLKQGARVILKCNLMLPQLWEMSLSGGYYATISIGLVRIERTAQGNITRTSDGRSYEVLYCCTLATT